MSFNRTGTPKKISHRELMRANQEAFKISHEIADKYSDLEKRHNEVMLDIRAVIDLCDSRPCWPFIRKGVYAILKKYRQ